MPTKFGFFPENLVTGNALGKSVFRSTRQSDLATLSVLCNRQQPLLVVGWLPVA